MSAQTQPGDQSAACLPEDLLRIPEHHEPDAAARLILALHRLFRELIPETDAPDANRVLTGVALYHPFLHTHIVSFLDQSQHIYGVPLRVELFQGDRTREPRFARTFLFMADGRVVVEKPNRQGQHPGAEQIIELQGWPSGVSRLASHLVRTLCRSSVWEDDAAAKLRALQQK